MNCPHCHRPVKLPYDAETNMRSYHNAVTTVTDCCNKMVIAYPVFQFEVTPSNAKQDDWGRRPNK